MRIYVLGETGQRVWIENERHERRYLYTEVQPCTNCREYRWTEQESTAIQRAVELILALSNFELDVFHALFGAYSGKDGHDGYCLGDLLRPFGQPFEYDSDKIGLWKTVLFLASYAGPSDIELAYLVTAHRKIGRLEEHVCEEHKLELKAISSSRRSFQEQHLFWIDAEKVLCHLPGLRGKSPEEIASYFKQHWDELVRCKKCRVVLDCYEHERGNSVCFKCEPQAAEAAS